jgi:hypothetical protein
MRVAHRKSVESRAQKRTNVGGVRPDGCGVPPLPASKKTKMTQCDCCHGIASSGGRRTEGLWLRTSVFDLPLRAVTLGSTGE